MGYLNGRNFVISNFPGFGHSFLAGISVWNHPGQSQKNLWVKHAIKKVDQHRQIISKKRQVVVTTIEAGTSLTVKKEIYKLDLCYEEYRQVQGAEKVAKLMSSVDKKEMKDFSPSVALHALLEETWGCSTQYVLLDMLEMGALPWLPMCSWVSICTWRSS